MAGEKMITLRVTPEYHKELKTYVVSQGTTFQQYIMELIKNDRKKGKS